MCKMTTKLLYLVLIVIITFEGTRGNVESGSPTSIKHVREVLPNSLLFLLQRRPTSGLGYKKITPVSPVPLSPSAPIEPCAPLPPSIPAIPNAPVSPSIPSSPEAPDVPNSGTVPNSFYPTIKYGQNDQQATQTSSLGQLSYDNPSNGNRKILNVVHIHPRQPVPVSHQTSQPLTTNPAVPDNKVTGESKDSSTNSFQVNPKDIAFEPVKNIEASPIPVKPQNTEVVPSQATNVDNDTKENKDLDKSTNTVQFNPKDIPYEPVKNLEASPIPVQPKNIEDVPSQATNLDSQTKENKDMDKSKNSFQIIPKDIPLEPVTNIEASPIPVQPKNTDVLPSQAPDVNSASPIAETSKEGKNPDLSSSAGNNEANTTPVKSQIKPELSEEKAADTDRVNTKDVSSSASEHNIADKASTTEEPQNPLKDLILNGNPSNKNADKEESKKADGSENKADTQNGNSSSKNEENEGEASEKHEDNLNKEATESESTIYGSPTDGTHSASTNDESKYTSFPEGSHSESTDHESEATSSDNSHSQSTGSQSESSSTKSNTESSNGPTSETVSSENTENKSSETKEGISSAEQPTL